MNQSIEIDGIPITIEKKRIRNLYIRILPPKGTVKVTAPQVMLDGEIQRTVSTRMEWICKKREAFLRQPQQGENQYITGERHFLWGKSYPLEVVISKKKAKVVWKEERIILQVPEESGTEQRKAIMEEWYRRELYKAVPGVLERCQCMVKKYPREWRIKNMRTRWGTCNVKDKRIWLNLQLAKKAPECLEYVIIHELVHLYERRHNAVFKAYMDQFYPNWQKVRNQLNAPSTDPQK